MKLLIDIGNTRIKWARLDERGLGAASAAVHADWSREQAREQLTQSQERPERVLVSNVGGARIGELVADVIGEAWGITAEFFRSTALAGGVRNAYPDPSKLGVDRMMAMIGAHAMHPRLVCIASVGTAMTVDAVDVRGHHLGGVIVPGPDLMVASLLKSTSDIAERARQGEVGTGLFADNTLGGITQGAAHALASLIDRSVATLQREVGEAPTLLLTGGASERVAPLVETRAEIVPDLVLRGLAVLSKEPGRA
jgi:type III pantothenate kinase